MTKKTQKKLRKALLLISCAALLVCITVGVTVAYLTDKATVTNTFTVGNVGIDMNETDVDQKNGTKDNEYHLLPGHTYVKDPTITVDADSEDCYLFVKVENNIAGIEDGTTNIAAQLTANGWTPVEGKANIYSYKEVANASDEIKVFENIKIADTVANDTLATYAGKTVVVTAYAVQADGFDGKTAAEIWTAAQFN